METIIIVDTANGIQEVPVSFDKPRSDFTPMRFNYPDEVYWCPKTRALGRIVAAYCLNEVTGYAKVSFAFCQELAMRYRDTVVETEEGKVTRRALCVERLDTYCRKTGRDIAAQAMEEGFTTTVDVFFDHIDYKRLSIPAIVERAIQEAGFQKMLSCIPTWRIPDDAAIFSIYDLWLGATNKKM